MHGLMGQDGQWDIAIQSKNNGIPWTHGTGWIVGYSYRVCLYDGIPRMSHRPMGSDGQWDIATKCARAWALEY